PRRVRRVPEAVEGLAALDGELVRGAQRVEQHRVEVDVREVDALFGPVVHVLASEVAVQVHLAEADRVRTVVAVLDRAYRGDVALVADRGQPADGRLDGLAQVSGIHRQGDVHR